MICVGDMLSPLTPLPIFEGRGQRGTVGSLVVVHFIIFLLFFYYFYIFILVSRGFISSISVFSTS